MQDFAFHRPSSLADAVAAMQGAEDGKFMGGGQSLLPVMKLDLAAPTEVISLAGLSELAGIRMEGEVLQVGAASTHTEVGESETVRTSIPALAELADGIGDPQVRNRGTLGGSVAHADPAADYPAALVALGATVVTDRREIAAEDFFQGMFATALGEDEIITAVRFPVPDAAAYAKFANPASKYAIAGVMVARFGSDVRVAVTGAGPSVFRAGSFESALSADFAASALDGIGVDPGDMAEDGDASAAYRAHLVGVMAKRAVEACG